MTNDGTGYEPEDVLGGRDRTEHEDELGGDAPGREDELGGPDPG